MVDLVKWKPQDDDGVILREDAYVKVRPANGPKRLSYMGELRNADNGHGDLGAICLGICHKHVVGFKGYPDDYTNSKDRKRFRNWEPDELVTVAFFIANGCRKDPDPEGNSGSSSAP